MRTHTQAFPWGETCLLYTQDLELTVLPAQERQAFSYHPVMTGRNLNLFKKPFFLK